MPSNLSPRGITVGFFGDSTGILDVAVASDVDDRVVFLSNNGLGQLSIPSGGEKSTGIVGSTFTVVGGEFDGRGLGNEDAITPGWADVGPFGCEPPFINDAIAVLRNEGDYIFTISQNEGGCADIPRNYNGIAKGRFQASGDNDLAATEVCRPFVDVILGDGIGGFAHNCSTDRYQMHPDSETFIDGVATGHLNGGTKTDVVAALTSANEVAVLLGRGNGTFQRPTTNSGYRYSTHDPAYPDSVRPVQVVVVDLDQDGFGDIVATNEDEHPPLRGALSVLINKAFVSIPPP